MNTLKSKFKSKLSTKLSVGFAFIAFVTVILITLSANILINKQFEEYVAEKQKNFSDEMPLSIEPQYNSETKEWNIDYIHGFGMYALNNGYIIKLYDNNKEIIWDASNHDMTLCHKTMQNISSRMKESRPSLDGEFSTHNYELWQNGELVGYLDVSYYGPYYFNDNDFHFLKVLNAIIAVVGVIAVIGAVFAGIIFAKKISVPVVSVTNITKEISNGNYNKKIDTNEDTTEIAQLVQAVNHMSYMLNEQENIRKRLTSDVAHELRTPVANVSANIEAMVEGALEPDNARLESCYNELLRITDIISDLEKLRQIENEKLVLERTSVDVKELCESVIQAFKAQLESKQISCTVNADHVSLMADRNRLYQVMANLISNAIKYTQNGGCINVDVVDNKDFVAISVKDNGIGINESDLPFIFERFYRTDKSRNRTTGGAGIGLAIVKAIVLAHGGEVSVESEEGVGSTFKVVLPQK
jgi:two-component system sensor histidine kinase BaeS